MPPTSRAIPERFDDAIGDPSPRRQAVRNCLVTIRSLLASLGVPTHLHVELQEKLAGTCDALLLYGSWARGDADQASDLDVLALNFKGAVLQSHGAEALGGGPADAGVSARRRGTGATGRKSMPAARARSR